MRRTAWTWALALAACGALTVSAQRSEFVSLSHPAIEYATRAAADPVAALNRRVASGEVTLTFDPASGYLRSVLDALTVPVESQTLVYSPTSLQSIHITPKNPRALYFNDQVAVGWVRGTDTLEISSMDPRQGAMFYQLAQVSGGRPQFTRTTQCLECHLSGDTAGIPGLLSMSMLPLSDDPNEYAVGWGVDHRTPITDRWGGWYVTGASVPEVHLGNVPVLHAPKGRQRAERAPNLASVREAFDATAYPVPYSDVVALMVLNHQTRMTNLLTRLNWLTRIAEHGNQAGRVRSDPPEPIRTAAAEVVDYLLFVDEAPLSGKVAGSSGFAEKFTAAGPRDDRDRSLRDLDLERRLLKYRCSYMIYSPAFDALPSVALDLVYRRMWQVLAGETTEERYRIPLTDRQAIAEILLATKEGTPKYFRQAIVK